MEVVWFVLLGFMLAAYVILDGFDLGAGALHLWVGRDDDGRRAVIRSIGPVWDGNEVWLLAAGATLVLAFPVVYATAFSGFYLPLMIVLWLLVLRAISIEFRNHIDSPAWKPVWDVVFSLSSLVLIVFFGAALGNVVRGVPFDAEGRFFAPLWTDFRTGGGGILDWYTVLVGVTAVVFLVLHGALWLAHKTAGDVHERAREVASRLWPVAVVVAVVVTAVTFTVQPNVAERMAGQPWGWLFPALAAAGLAGVAVYTRRGEDGRAFLSSCLFLFGMMTSVAFGMFPLMLPGIPGHEHAITIYNAGSGPYARTVALWWWIPGMVLVTGYFVFTYRRFAGKVTLDEEGY